MGVQRDKDILKGRGRCGARLLCGAGAALVPRHRGADRVPPPGRGVRCGPARGSATPAPAPSSLSSLLAIQAAPEFEQLISSQIPSLLRHLGLVSVACRALCSPPLKNPITGSENSTIHFLKFSTTN